MLKKYVDCQHYLHNRVIARTVPQWLGTLDKLFTTAGDFIVVNNHGRRLPGRAGIFRQVQR